MDQTGNADHKDGITDLRFIYRILYSKLDTARYLGHLETVQVFFRAFRRAQLPLLYSQGYNPSPKVSFSPALSLGTESHAEYMIVELAEPVKDFQMCIALLNRNLPKGLQVTSMEMAAKKQAGTFEICYHVMLDAPPSPSAIEAFLGVDEYILRLRKGKKIREIDVRPLVRHLSVSEVGEVEMILAGATGKASVKPLELLRAILNLQGSDVIEARVTKIWHRETEVNSES